MRELGPHAKYWFGVAHLSPWDLDASLELAEDRLPIELRRLRQPVGFRDRLFRHTMRAGKPVRVDAVKSGCSSLLSPASLMA